MIVIDRIENTIAILEVNGETLEIPAAVLPQGAEEGSVLQLTLCDDEATRLQRENEERLKRLRERDSGDMNIEL